MIQLLLILSMCQFVSCAFQMSDRTIAARRKFSSPEKLVLNRLHVAQAKQYENCSMLKRFENVRNIDQTVQHLNQLIIQEINQHRKKMIYACVKFQEQISKLKKFDSSISFDESIKTNFLHLSLSVDLFYQEYLDLFMFDNQLLKCSQFFNKHVLYEMRQFATKYKFSKEYIPPYVFPVYEVKKQ